MTIRHLLEILPDGLKHAIDAISIVALFSSLISLMPAASTLMTFIWASLRVYETPTVQGWLKRRRDRSKP